MAYRNLTGKTAGLYVRAADGSGQERQIEGRYDGVVTVTDWSPDGRYLIVVRTKFLGPQNWHDTLQVVRVTGEPKTELKIDNARNGKVSPDGYWLAYQDNSSGQLFVSPFLRPGGRIAVSAAGGGDPRGVVTARSFFMLLTTKPSSQSGYGVTAGISCAFFSSAVPPPAPGNVGFYDVTRDGKRFLVNIRTHKEQAAPLTVVTNWPAQLQAK